MKKQEIKIGARFGRLKVVCRHTPKPAERGRHFLVVCRCGQWRRVPASKLTSGNTTSCGCLRLDKVRIANRRRRTHGKTGIRLHRIWHGMMQRCYYAKHAGFDRYGGRVDMSGLPDPVTVCAEWHKFENFYNWAKTNGYKNRLTLDRRDNKGHYEPSNCRWVTWKVQRANQEKNPRGEWDVT